MHGLMLDGMEALRIGRNDLHREIKRYRPAKWHRSSSYLRAPYQRVVEHEPPQGDFVPDVQWVKSAGPTA
jgi:hypothetical protein